MSDLRKEVSRRIKPGSLRFYPKESKHTMAYFQVSYEITKGDSE